MCGPIRGRFDKRSNERCEIFRRSRMGSKQDNAGLFQGKLPLKRDLPEILHSCIFPPRTMRSSPKYVVAIGAKPIDNRLREVLIGE
jgi:hypothetical protein